MEKMESLEKQLQEVTMESEEKDRLAEEIVEQRKAAEKRAEVVIILYVAYYIYYTITDRSNCRYM